MATPVELDDGGTSLGDEVEAEEGIAVGTEVLDDEVAGGETEETGKAEPLLFKGGASSGGSRRSGW